MESILKIGILSTEEEKQQISEAISHFPPEPNVEFTYYLGDERTVTHPEITILIAHKGVNRQNLSDILKAHPNVKWVYTFSTGIEHMLAPDFVQSQIHLANAKNCFSESLGEFAAFAMLYFSNHASLFLKQKEQKIWKKHIVQVVKAKTLAIIGYGDIGVEVAKRAKRGFEMNIIGVKRNPLEVSEEAKSYADKIIRNEAYEEAVKDADFVISILPGHQTTYHYFDLSKFKLMKPSAVFLSIGRGTAVKESDLIQALEQKIIRGAALDVYEKEPLPSESKLWELQNVLMFPHSADNTSDFGDLAYKMFLKNLRAYVKGEPLASLVNKKKGY